MLHKLRARVNLLRPIPVVKAVLGYHYDALGHLWLIAPVNRDHIPPRCTTQPPPDAPDGFVPVWSPDGWEMESEALAALARADYEARWRWFGITSVLSALRF